MKDIEKMRARIDEIDKKIAEAIGERYELVEKIGKLKKCNGRTLIDGKREGEIMGRYQAIGLKSGIDEKQMRQVARDVIEMGRRAQKWREDR